MQARYPHGLDNSSLELSITMLKGRNAMALKRHILIGGASRGIGLGLTRAFLEAGWQVHAVARSLPDDSPLLALQQQWPHALQLIQADLNAADAGERIIQALAGQRLACALFNAGVSTPRHADALQASVEELGQLFLANAVAPLRLAQRLAGEVEDDGVVAFMSSQMGSQGLAMSASMPLYGASKAALNSLLVSWHAQQPRPWSVLALHPGWVRTDMGGDAAPLSVEQSAAGLLHVITGQLGRRELAFLDYQGETLPW